MTPDREHRAFIDEWSDAIAARCGLDLKQAGAVQRQSVRLAVSQCMAAALTAAPRAPVGVTNERSLHQNAIEPASDSAKQASDPDLESGIEALSRLVQFATADGTGPKPDARMGADLLACVREVSDILRDGAVAPRAVAARRP